MESSVKVSADWGSLGLSMLNSVEGSYGAWESESPFTSKASNCKDTIE